MTATGRRLGEKAAARLIQAAEPWMSCDECFALTDRCVEDLLERNRAPGTAMAVHLAACPACRDDVTSLLTLLARDLRTDASAALTLTGGGEANA